MAIAARRLINFIINFSKLSTNCSLNGLKYTDGFINNSDRYSTSLHLIRMWYKIIDNSGAKIKIR